MATTGDAPLNLTKPEAADVVSLSVINTNYDTINTNAAAVAATLATQTGQISTLNTAVGAGGAVVKATNIAGGLNRQIPYQSAVNTTAFTSAPAAIGQVLTAGVSNVTWGYPTPYKIASGTIAAASFTSGVSSAVTLTGFTQPPIVMLTPIHSNLATAMIASLSAAPTSISFIARLRTIANGSSDVGAPATAVDVQWVAIQVSP